MAANTVKETSTVLSESDEATLKRLIQAHGLPLSRHFQRIKGKYGLCENKAWDFHGEFMSDPLHTSGFHAAIRNYKTPQNCADDQQLFDHLMAFIKRYIHGFICSKLTQQAKEPHANENREAEYERRVATLCVAQNIIDDEEAIETDRAFSAIDVVDLAITRFFLECKSEPREQRLIERWNVFRAMHLHEHEGPKITEIFGISKENLANISRQGKQRLWKLIHEILIEQQITASNTTVVYNKRPEFIVEVLNDLREFIVIPPPYLTQTGEDDRCLFKDEREQTNLEGVFRVVNEAITHDSDSYETY